MKGVVNDDGTQIHLKSFTPGSIDVIDWLSEEEKNKLLADREPAEAPVLPDYIKVQPENQGKLLWFSGPPGAGKSTTAQLMAKKYGYVYYEADCVRSFVNPFIDVDVPNPTMAQMNQKPLKGVSKNLLKLNELTSQMAKQRKEQNDKEYLNNFDHFITEICTLSAEDILFHKNRIGGHWAVALAVSSKKHREVLRKAIGSDLYIFVLNLTRESNLKRLIERHGAEHGKEMAKMFEKIIKQYEPAEDDEVNTFNIEVTEEMTPDDVVEKAMSCLKK